MTVFPSRNVFNIPLIPSRMFEKILIATEGTPIMNNAMCYAATLFSTAEFHVISVVDTSVGSIHPTAALVKVLEEKKSSGSSGFFNAVRAPSRPPSPSSPDVQPVSGTTKMLGGFITALIALIGALIASR